MTGALRKLALVFAAAGLCVSLLAAYTHYRMLADVGYVSFCDVSATVSCTEVYSSRFGTFGGVPVAVFGAIWFGFATLVAIAGLVARPSVRESVPAYLFVGSTIALAGVLYLAWASFFVLKLVCPLCVITYAAVIGLFLVSGAATSIRMTTLPRRAIQDLKVLLRSPVALTLTLLFIGGTGSMLAFFPFFPDESVSVTESQAPGNQQSDFERWYTAQPRVPLVIPTEGAKVLVVKFNDYQCPPCRQSYMQYKSIFAKYESAEPGAVRLVLQDFPLESECNANVPSDLHAAACEAAVGVRLSREHKRAEAFEEWLFENQARMTPQLVREGVRDVGGVQNFDARYTTVLEQVRADIAYGRQLGVRSTPTFFINGVKVEGALPAPFFDQAIAYELKRAESQ